MGRKTDSGQVLIEFLVLLICLGCLYSVIRYKAVELHKTKQFRWEKQ